MSGVFDSSVSGIIFEHITKATVAYPTLSTYGGKQNRLSKVIQNALVFFRWWTEGLEPAMISRGAVSENKQRNMIALHHFSKIWDIFSGYNYRRLFSTRINRFGICDQNSN